MDFIAENTSFSPINPRNLNIDKFYNTERLRPFYNSFEMNPLFIMNSEG